MPHAGSQVILCGLPIHFDTYKGCSHGCKYCFTQRKTDLRDIGAGEGVESIRKFVEGRRTQETNWCDWDIPLHWGAMSDPFQPIEVSRRSSLKVLELFAKTKYPFVVSTKGECIARPEYLQVLKECNCVVQISAVCPEYDKIEKGAPSFERRMEIATELSAVVPRVNIRAQPYMIEVLDSVLSSIPAYKRCGAHGIILEGMKFFHNHGGLIKIGGDFCYPLSTLTNHFGKIKTEAHKNGLVFYCGENRLRSMSDELTCCGIEGLAGFIGNDYNICSMMNGSNGTPTPAMMKKHSALCFKSMFQSTAECNAIKKHAFSDAMMAYYLSRRSKCAQMFGGNPIGGA